MTGTPWREAMRTAADLPPAPAVRVGLESAIGARLAQPVVAQSDLPPVASAAGAGYAVRGIGPWRIRPTGTTPEEGEAVAVRGGDPLPPDTLAVVGSREAVVESDIVLVGDPATGRPGTRPGMATPGEGITTRATQATAGEVLGKAGTTVTAGTVALAAAAGMDELVVIPPATVAPLVITSDFLDSGPPRRGRNRDIVAALLPAWIMGSGARCLPGATAAPTHAAAVADRVAASDADLTVVTAGADPGPTIASALRRAGGTILLERVAAHPADAVLLAQLGAGRRVLVLPRDPAAAVVNLALLLSPMIASLSGHPTPPVRSVMLRADAPGSGERAVPVQVESGELADLAVAQPWVGPFGLTPVGTCNGIAFLGAGRGRRGDTVPVISLPGRS